MLDVGIGNELMNDEYKLALRYIDEILVHM